MQPLDTIPEGFNELSGRPGFTCHIGGVYLDQERATLGALIRPEHLNPANIAHGGFLATLADSSFGVAFQRHLDTAIPPLTVTLNIDYIGAVREGEWVEAHVDIHKVGRTLAYASTSLKVGERVVLRANGVFILGQAGKNSSS